MSRWRQIARDLRVHAIYGPHFPVELRHLFADWIEEQNWEAYDEDKLEHVNKAQEQLDVLLEKIRDRAATIGASASVDAEIYALKLRLEELRITLQQRYQENPLSLIFTIRSCLLKEEELAVTETKETRSLSRRTGDMETRPSSRNPTLHLQQALLFIPPQVWASGVRLDAPMSQEIVTMQSMLQTSKELVETVREQQEYFLIQHQELSRMQALSMRGSHPSRTIAFNTQKAALEKNILEEGAKIGRNRQYLFGVYQGALATLDPVLQTFTEKLETWKQIQRVGIHEENFLMNSLAPLQIEAECLSRCLWLIYQQVQQLKILQDQLYMKQESVDNPSGELQLSARVIEMLRRLFCSSFIVEKQPCQLLKVQGKFMSVITLLCGRRFNFHLNPPTVKAVIISEAQLQQLQQHDRGTTTFSFASMLESMSSQTGTLLNDKVAFESSSRPGALRAFYKNLSLRRIRRSIATKETAGSTLKVAEEEERYYLLFHTTLMLGELPFFVHAVSLPVLVISNAPQFGRASACVVWDNLTFSKDRLSTPGVPDEIPWPLAAAMINTHFFQSCRMSLNQGDMEYLREKVLVTSLDQPIRFNKLVKENLPRRSFAFWDWFYAASDLVKNHLHGPWLDGLIHGFLNKSQAQELLLFKPPGTFLLRFSDSELGGITVAWVGEDDAGNRRVWHLQPWFSKDLTIRSLPDRLSDLPQLEFLFPDLPKDVFFGKYYASTANEVTLPGSDYVRVDIAAIMHVGNQVKGESLRLKYEPSDWSVSSSGFPNGLDMGAAGSLLETPFANESASVQTTSVDPTLASGTMAPTSPILETINPIDLNALLTSLAHESMDELDLALSASGNVGEQKMDLGI